MRRTVRLLVAFSISWSAFGWAWADESPGLSEKVSAIMQEPPYDRGLWGALLVDRATGEVIESKLADQLFIPASVTKIYSSAAALEVLGPDYRFQTPVYKRGTLGEDGTLTGDLILVGKGDLTLGGRTTAAGEISFTDADHTYESRAVLTTEDPLAGLDELARQVRAAGIQKVVGEIIVDDRLFAPVETTGSGPHLLWPIMVNDNVIDLIIKPTTPGSPAEVDWRPKSQRVVIEADVETVHADKTGRVEVRVHSPGCISVRGTVEAPAEGKEAKPTVRIVEIEQPATFVRGLWIESLNRAGVKTSASVLDANPSLADVPVQFEQNDRVAVLESPPFRENIRLILKVSHNLHATALPILMGLTQGTKTLNKGFAVQRDALTKLGVDVERISLGSGAGGARTDLVSPAATVKLLLAMASHRHFADFERGLPVIGVDGTLADVVDPGAPAVARVRAKTGTFWWEDLLNDRMMLTSKALAGYIKAKSGRELVFALFVNYVPMASSEERRRAGKTLGRVCAEWVEQY